MLEKHITHYPYHNSPIKEVYTTLDGKLHGSFKTYRPDDLTLETDIKYINGEKKRYVYYDSYGNITLIASYRMGNLSASVQFRPNTSIQFDKTKIGLKRDTIKEKTFYNHLSNKREVIRHIAYDYSGEVIYDSRQFEEN